MIPDPFINDAEAVGKFLANALSRFHVQINGWLALGVIVTVNLIGVFLHV